MVNFEKPTIEAVRHIAFHMRQADRDEVWASDHKTPLQSLLEGWEISDRVAIVTIKGEPCVMMGLVVRDILSGVGVPWMLGTEGAVRYRKQFLTLAPVVIDEMLSICPTLYNYVHAENKVSIAWLKRLGFTIEKPEPYGNCGELFHKFHLEKVNHV